MTEYLIEKCKSARDASLPLAAASSAQKDEALRLISKELIESSQQIIKANSLDLENAKAKGIGSAMLDRLTLDEKRISAIASSIRKVINLPDPVGTGECFVRPNGLKISKIHVPIGILGIIYEARPNVTVDAAVLSLKSGNACILRGGSEAVNSNIAIVSVMKSALKQSSLSPDCIQLIEDTSRQTVNEMMQLKGYIDVLIPRGGAGLIKTVVENSKIPVIETGAGNCHIYVDETADLEMAVSILFNAKTSRPSVCNAVETLLVNRNIAEKFLPAAQKKLSEKNVALRGCEQTRKILPDISEASEEDYYTEYNDYILAIKVVDDVKEAVGHINKYNTKHSEAIVTSSMENADYFKKNVDAAAVYVNASTRFTDGEEFGLGAEIGISTQKLHARGPMGLYEMTTVKYLIDGNGQVR